MVGEVAFSSQTSVWAGLSLVWAVGCNPSAWTCPVSFAERRAKVPKPGTGKAKCFRVHS